MFTTTENCEYAKILLTQLFHLEMLFVNQVIHKNIAVITAVFTLM